jgi:beta-lactamase regulating signal transducer with metallopeptidase domain
MSFLESILSAEFIRTFAWTLFHSIWQGALIALLTGGIMLIFRKHRPALRYLFYYVLLVLLPVLFVITFLAIYNPGNQVVVTGAGAGMAGWETISGKVAQTTAPAANIHNVKWYTIPARLFENNAHWLVLIWFIGFLFFLLRFSGSVFYVYRLKHQRLYPVEKPWQEKLGHLSSSLGIKKKISLSESALAQIPMTIGYLKPVILLPLGTISGVPPQQLEAILLHELAHILRRDYLLNLFQSVIEMLFFYQPVTWWLSGLIRQEREHICDDLVIAVNHDHLNYIKALTNMEEINLKSPKLAHALTGPDKKLLYRVKRMLMPSKLRNNPGEGIIAFVLLICLAFVLSLNALSVIPDAYDLTGRESGGKIHNLAGFNLSQVKHNEPEKNQDRPSGISPVSRTSADTVTVTSKSGKVTISVYIDSTGTANQKDVQVIVEALDDHIGNIEHQRNEYEKQVIIMNKNTDQLDSLSKIIIIKNGDSVKVYQNDTILMFPEGFDSTFTAINPYGIYGFDTPEIPEFPEYRDMPDSRYFGEIPHEWRWTQRAPEPKMDDSERIIRQELFDDGLTNTWKKYVIEINSKSMYINGEKQPKEVCKKYRKLVESLGQGSLEGDDTYKLIF